MPAPTENNEEKNETRRIAGRVHILSNDYRSVLRLKIGLLSKAHSTLFL